VKLLRRSGPRRAAGNTSPSSPGSASLARCSASDVIRLAAARLRDQLPDAELRTELIAYVRAEAGQYPGRARHGLPKDDQPSS
jgi:hypothetical protein